MTNPAQDLADLLVNWNREESTTTARRAAAMGVEAGSLEFWIGMNQAVELLGRYVQLLEGLETAGRNVAHYRSQLVQLHRLVYAPDFPWNAPAMNHVETGLSEVDYDRLLLAADALDGVRIPTADLDSARIVQHLKEALEVAHELPEGTAREQLMWLIGQAIYFAKGLDSFGAATVEEMTSQVVTRMDQIATGDDDDVTTDLRERASRVRDSLTLALYTTVTTEVAKRGLEGLEHIIKAISS